jgi:hypothetical protein
MMMHRMFLMITVSLLALAARPAKAQAAHDTAMLFAEMKQLQDVYSRSLSFDIRFTYASERQPGSVIDSALGRIELSGSNYHYWLDSVETMVNKNYSLTLFKKDKVMYLARPSTIRSPVDPVQQMRTVLERSGYKSCTVTQQGALKTLRIEFSTGAYRQMEMTVDRKSGYVTCMRYVVKTSMLMEEGTPASPEEVNTQYGEYAIVQTTFDHYQLLPADYTGFDESSFFYKEGGEYKTALSYNDYKIFTGSPNL